MTDPMSGLRDRRILIGVTGGVAAYKTAELVRLLRREDAQVRVAMTRSAARFITPLTMQALSGQPVLSEWSDPSSGSGMEHIEWARWADAILIAPASADFLARLRQGRADDPLGAICLASDRPLFLAPAMNQGMWRNPATQENVACLRERGANMLGPDIGGQACGEHGEGRMTEPAELLAGLREEFKDRGLLQSVRVMVTAGPTREFLDPIRYLSNRSSGRMGYAIAQAASRMQAQVRLISGPVSLTPPIGVERITVDTARQMYSAVMRDIERTDIFIAAAAVADYRPAHAADTKLEKRSQPSTTLELEPTPDILATVAAAEPAPFTVGFAAETERLRAYAKDKLREKRIDMVAANLVGEGLGMETEDNALTLFWQDGETSWQRMPKPQLARQLLRAVAARYRAAADPT